MKKYLKVICCILGIPVFSFLGFYLYLVLPSLFPKYAINSCVEDTQVQRIHQIVGTDDRLKGDGVPTVVLKTGSAVPGTHEVGSKESIFHDDPHIKRVACP
jgi:hypothetical protein